MANDRRVDPYQPPNDSTASRPLANRFRFAPLAVWSFGYALQFALFAAFIESWNSDRVFFSSSSDDLKLLLFGCPIIACGLISTVAISFMNKRWTVAARSWGAIGSMLLFGATWFGFGLFLLANLYSRMRN